MWKFMPYIAKNLWRNRTRSALTISGAAVAMFVFTFVGSVQDGMADLNRGSKTERTLIVFQANRFCPSTSRLQEDYAGKIAKMPGVEDAVPIKVYMNNCRASLDVVVFNGLPAEKLRKIRDLKIVDGDWSAFEKQRDAAVVGQALATRRNLSVGQRFSIGAVTVTIAAIFSAANGAEESFIYTHLEFLQWTPGSASIAPGADVTERRYVTQIEVVLAEGTDANAMCRTIDEKFRGGPVQSDTRPKGVFQARAVGDLVELIGFTHYLGYACVALVLTLVGTTTLMAVQDRVREHAVLQTLGYSWRRIFGFVMIESVIVSLIGGTVGIGLALAVLSWKGLAIGSEGVTIAFSTSPGLALTGLLATLIVGVVAGLAPAWTAARAEIVESLRSI
ncbi:MAG: ABC transporter permease [Planctomycetes bacterium]|nr:ABC transporter permease [Planctomycetota bacterium]